MMWKERKEITSLPVLTHPLISFTTSRPIILYKIILVRASSTCSVVARSALSFMFALAEGPLRFTPTPRSYGRSRFFRREAYFESA